MLVSGKVCFWPSTQETFSAPISELQWWEFRVHITSATKSCVYGSVFGALYIKCLNQIESSSERLGASKTTKKSHKLWKFHLFRSWFRWFCLKLSTFNQVSLHFLGSLNLRFPHCKCGFSWVWQKASNDNSMSWPTPKHKGNGCDGHRLGIMAGQPTPPYVPPLRNKGFIRPY